MTLTRPCAPSSRRRPSSPPQPPVRQRASRPARPPRLQPDRQQHPPRLRPPRQRQRRPLKRQPRLQRKHRPRQQRRHRLAVPRPSLQPHVLQRLRHRLAPARLLWPNPLRPRNQLTVQRPPRLTQRPSLRLRSPPPRPWRKSLPLANLQPSAPRLRHRPAPAESDRPRCAGFPAQRGNYLSAQERSTTGWRQRFRPIRGLLSVAVPAGCARLAVPVS